jgi:hypothetical protein
MTSVLLTLVVVLALAVAALALLRLHDRPRRRRLAAVAAPAVRRILFPFIANALSRPALDAALRLSIAEGATLVPVFLARVPMQLPLEAPLPRQSGICIPLQEAIDQRASAAGVPVDARIERGRNYRHALRRAIQTERFDWIVIAAATQGSHGFDADDVAWLLNHAPGEIVVLRPSEEEQIVPHPPRRHNRMVSREYETAASR